MPRNPEGKDSGPPQTNDVQPILARQFPAKSPIDREQARMLVNDIGFNEAAKRLGINVDTLYQWKHRFGWGKAIAHPKAQSAVRLVRTSPAEAQEDVLADISKRTRMQIAKVALRSAKSVKAVPVRSARDLKDIAGTITAIDPEKAPSDGITLNVLNVAGDIIQG